MNQFSIQTGESVLADIYFYRLGCFSPEQRSRAAGWDFQFNGANNSNKTNHAMALAQRVEETRAICLQNRRIICGKYFEMLPTDGRDSGYTNLMPRALEPILAHSRTVPATRATNLVEATSRRPFASAP